MVKNEIFRETKSICHLCNKITDAVVLGRGNQVFLTKFCPQHGTLEIFLAQSNYYRELEKFYCCIIDRKLCKNNHSAELFITFKCNMNCPVCFLGGLKIQLIDFEPTLQDIENFIKDTKERTIILTGGETTCRNDLIDIVKIIKKYNKSVGIKTNGIKLIDFNYVLKLKEAGIDEIEIQFTGFNPTAEETLRGENYISIKLNALENLKKAGIPTRINMLVAAGLNENQVGKVIDFSVKNHFIRMINFCTLQFAGNAKEHFGLDRYLMPDNIAQIIEEYTRGKITRKNIYLLKKLEIVINSFLNKTTCLYTLIFLIIRSGSTYNTIDSYINLNCLERILNRYLKLYRFNINLAKIYLLFILPLGLIFNISSPTFLKELFCCTVAFLTNSKYLAKSNRFIYLLLTTECDMYRMDYAVYNSCPCKLLHFFDNQNGVFKKVNQPLESIDWILKS